MSGWRRDLFPAYVAHDSGHWVGPRLDVTRGLPKFDVTGLAWRAAHTDFTTIPRLSVPFREWWMEAADPDRCQPYAAHFRAYEKEPGEPEVSYVRRLDSATQDALRRWPAFRLKAIKARWIVTEQRVHQLNRDMAFPGGTIAVAVDPEGDLLSVAGSFTMVEDTGEISNERLLREGLRERDDVIEALDLEGASEHARSITGETRDKASITSAGFLGLALIGCSNVTCTAETGRESHKLPESDLSGPEGTRYRMLEIDPMRSREDGDGDGHEDEPLHIVRGHFKDYRDGAGLFGRINGVFYWEPHVRGNPERGRQVKDYRIGSGGDVNPLSVTASA